MKNTPTLKTNLLVAGTKFPRDNREAALARLAEFWRRASEQMNVVAKAGKIKYHHFLQPNQYVADSKPMSGEERNAAFLEGKGKIYPYANAARSGYPHTDRPRQIADKGGCSLS